jgi:hypothetical protein
VWWLSPFTGLLSVGEATRHNRHHRFPRDPRIGNRVHDNDAGKWELYGAWFFSHVLRCVGLPPLVWDTCIFTAMTARSGCSTKSMRSFFLPAYESKS